MSLKVTFIFIQAAVPLAAGAVALAGLAGVARADRRAYGETYEAVTAVKGELDVELWTTYARLGEVDGGPASRGVRQMVELEYGVTERWDVALYNMADLTSGASASGYAGLKLESRYRPTLTGEWFVDPVFYVEAQQLFRGDADQKLEAKLILAKDLDAWNVAFNLAGEVERLADHSLHPEVEYALGTSYEVSPALKLGLETFGKAEPADGGGVDNRTWLGPAISWATGVSVIRGLWLTLAGGAGITADADPLYGRLVVGLQF